MPIYHNNTIFCKRSAEKMKPCDITNIWYTEEDVQEEL